MTEMHYGIVRVDGRWSIIGDNLRFGAYETRGQARAAARRLAEHPAGLGIPVLLHEQEEDGMLPRPTVLS